MKYHISSRKSTRSNFFFLVIQRLAASGILKIGRSVNLFPSPSSTEAPYTCSPPKMRPRHKGEGLFQSLLHAGLIQRTHTFRTLNCKLSELEEGVRWRHPC